MRRILVIRLGALGDFAQSFAPFAAIRDHHRNDSVTLLTTAPFVELARAVIGLPCPCSFLRHMGAMMQGLGRVVPPVLRILRHGGGLWLDPRDMTLRVIHARISVDMGMAQQAVSDLTPLPDDATLRVDALVTRAAANRELGHIDLAATDIAAALQQAPHNVAAELECGILHERQGRMEDARADWQQVIALAPDSHEADLARQDLSLLEADPAAP